MPRVKLAGDTYLDKDLSELIRRYKYGKKLNNVEAGKLVGIGNGPLPGIWKSRG